MNPKPGYKTTEFWITAVANIAGSIVALLAGYALIKSEEGELWLALAQSLALAVIPLVLAFVNGRYIECRSEVKREVERGKVAELQSGDAARGLNRRLRR